MFFWIFLFIHRNSSADNGIYQPQIVEEGKIKSIKGKFKNISTAILKIIKIDIFAYEATVGTFAYIDIFSVASCEGQCNYLIKCVIAREIKVVQYASSGAVFGAKKKIVSVFDHMSHVIVGTVSSITYENIHIVFDVVMLVYESAESAKFILFMYRL